MRATLSAAEASPPRAATTHWRSADTFFAEGLLARRMPAEIASRADAICLGLADIRLSWIVTLTGFAVVTDMKRLTIAILLAGCSTVPTEPGWPDAGPIPDRPLAGREAFEEPIPGQGTRLGGFLFPEGRCAPVVESRTVGSFTGPGRRQSLFVVHDGGCGPGSDGFGPRAALVFEGAERVARWESSGPAVARIDVNADGTDEWVEASRTCHLGSCVGAFSVRSEGKEVARIEEAYLYLCGPGGNGTVSWKELQPEMPGIRAVRKTSPCGLTKSVLLD